MIGIKNSKLLILAVRGSLSNNLDFVRPKHDKCFKGSNKK